jgi:ABC-type phosphate transport system permease subunit
MPLLVGRHHLVVLSLLLFCLAALIQLHGVFDANNAYAQQAAFVLMWFPVVIAFLEYAYASISTNQTENPTAIQQNNHHPVLTHPPPPSGSDVATSPP